MVVRIRRVPQGNANWHRLSPALLYHLVRQKHAVKSGRDQPLTEDLASPEPRVIAFLMTAATDYRAQCARGQPAMTGTRALPHRERSDSEH
jgi:hypothetical protein